MLQLAQLFGAGGVDATFTLDRLQVSLDRARGVVVQANRKLVKALRPERALARRDARSSGGLRQRACSPTGSSSITGPFRRAVVRAAAQARVADLRATLQRAEIGLASARDRSLASSFSPAAGSLLGAPSFDSGYVFPVGGGPSLVSVSHHHHDYPAADIAAPEGSPSTRSRTLVVVRAWQYPDGRCGIGVTMRTADGQSSTYCHLSYLDPALTGGVQLAAGTQLGLVGSTGHATGPHLHLQLDPATSYPQLQPWFQRFAEPPSAGRTPARPTPAPPAPGLRDRPPETDRTEGSVVRFTR